MNKIIATKTSGKTSKVYDILGKFDSSIIAKKSTKSYKTCTEFSEVEFDIMQILAKMTENSKRDSREIYASLSKKAKVRAYKNKESNAVYREFTDYAKLGTDEKIINAVNTLLTFGIALSYVDNGNGITVEKNSGLISCGLSEKIIRLSETSGLYYLSSVRKFRQDVETKTFLELLVQSKDFAEYQKSLSERLHTDKDFAKCISEEIARKVEIAKKWKELSGKSIDEIADEIADLQDVI